MLPQLSSRHLKKNTSFVETSQDRVRNNSEINFHSFDKYISLHQNVPELTLEESMKIKQLQGIMKKQMKNDEHTEKMKAIDQNVKLQLKNLRKQRNRSDLITVNDDLTQDSSYPISNTIQPKAAENVKEEAMQVQSSFHGSRMVSEDRKVEIFNQETLSKLNSNSSNLLLNPNSQNQNTLNHSSPAQYLKAVVPKAPKVHPDVESDLLRSFLPQSVSELENLQQSSRFASHIQTKFDSLKRILNDEKANLDDLYAPLIGKKQPNRCLEKANSSRFPVHSKKYASEKSLVKPRIIREELKRIDEPITLSRNEQNVHGQSLPVIPSLLDQGPSHKLKQTIKYVKNNSSSRAQLSVRQLEQEAALQLKYGTMLQPKVQSKLKIKEVVAERAKSFVQSQQLTAAFPHSNIKIRIPDHLEFANALDDAKVKEILDHQIPTVFSAGDGSKKLIENELSMHCKLSRINKVVSQMFQKATHFNQITRVVKYKDVSELPSKRQSHSVDSGSSGKKYAKQLFYVPKNYNSSKLFRDFLKGGRIRDHSGDEISARGTVYNKMGRMAITEDQLNKEEAELLKQMEIELAANPVTLTPKKRSNSQLSFSSGSNSPMGVLKEYFRRKEFQKKIFSNIDIHQLQEQTPKQEKEAEGDENKKEKQLSPEIMQFINHLKKQNTIKDQKNQSKKLLRNFISNNKPKGQLADARETRNVIFKPEGSSVTGFSSSIQRSSRVDRTEDDQPNLLGDPETAPEKKQSYLDIKSKTIKSLKDAEKTQSTIMLQTQGGDDHSSPNPVMIETNYTLFGSLGVADSTLADFKDKMAKVRKRGGKSKSKKKKDFMTDLAEQVVKIMKDPSKTGKSQSQKKKAVEAETSQHGSAIPQKTKTKLFTVFENKGAAESKETQEKMLNKMIKDIKVTQEHSNHMQTVLSKIQHQETLRKSGTIELSEGVEEDLSDGKSVAQAMGPKTQQQKEVEGDALKVFIKECLKQNVLTNNILKNIKNKVLNLINLSVDHGLLSAISKFIRNGSKNGEVVNSFIFCNNKFSNEQLHALLEAMTEPKSKIKSIVIINNMIGHDAVQSLVKVIEPKEIILRDEPHLVYNHLHELVLNNSKLQQAIDIGSVMESVLSHQLSHLKRLGISGHYMDESSLGLLNTFLSSSNTLKKLDISFLKISSINSLIQILETLTYENSVLQYLNISGLSYIGNRNISESLEMRRKYAESIIFLIQASQSLIHLNLSICFPGVQYKAGEYQRVLLNPRIDDIIEDDLEKPKDPPPLCELSCLFNAISRSKTLQSVHYSGNNLSIQSLCKIQEILKIDMGEGLSRVQKDYEINKMFGNLDSGMDYDAIQKAVSKMEDTQKRKRMQKQEIKAASIFFNLNNPKQFKRQIPMRPQETPQFENSLRHLDLLPSHNLNIHSELPEKDRLSLDYTIQESSISVNDRIILQRNLGFQEIQTGHRWKIRSECWICHQWSYVLFVWSSKLGQNESLFNQKQASYMNEWEDEVIKSNDLISYKHLYDMSMHQEHYNLLDVHDCPRVVGPSTNYKFKKMLPMTHFIEKIMGNSRSWLRVYEEAEEVERIEAYREKMNQVITEAEQAGVNRDWPHTLDNYAKMGHKQMYLNIMKLLRHGVDPTDRYYCYADIFPPLPHQVQLAIQSKSEPKISVLTHKFQTRVDEPLLMFKQIKKKRLKRKFDLSKSLFHSWKADLQKHYKKCFLADMKYSKIFKFVKDPADFQQVQDVLLENYELIYELYVFGQSTSNYPSVSMVDFTSLCKRWNLISKRDLTSIDIDRLFFAVNFEEVKGDQGGDLEDNPDTELCRYEFFEILVRMAKLKYENQNLGLTVSQAVSKLVNDYLKKVAFEQTWKTYRKRDIWTLEVHDMLEANQAQLKLFMQWWIKTKSSKQGRRQLNLDDITEMFQMTPKGSNNILKKELGVNEEHYMVCFANSKFIVIDEMTNADYLMVLKYDEFLEFITRLADFATFANYTEIQAQTEEAAAEEGQEEEKKEENEFEHQQQQIPLEEKVFRVIDLILRLCRDPKVNWRAKRPKVKGLGDSESDYDSF